MAVAIAVQSVMSTERPKDVHPFFSAKRDTHEARPVTPIPDAPAPQTSIANSFVHAAHDSEQKHANDDTSDLQNGQKESAVRQRAKQATLAGFFGGGAIAETCDDPEPDTRPRKRRKADNASNCPKGSKKMAQQDEVRTNGSDTGRVEQRASTDQAVPRSQNAVQSSPAAALTNDKDGGSIPAAANPMKAVQPVSMDDPNTTLGQAHRLEDESVPVVPPTIKTPTRSTPKKLLKLNKRGTFSSPTSVASSQSDKTELAGSPSRKRRGRPRKTFVAVLKYGADKDSRQRLGQRINDMVGGKAVSAHTQEKPAAAKPPGPPKPTHPFFGKGSKEVPHTISKQGETGKTKTPVRKSAIESPKRTAVTPGKLRAEAHASREAVSFADFGKAAPPLARKSAGNVDVAWPTRELRHVRGLFDTILPKMPPRHDERVQARKLKGTKLHVAPREDLLVRLTEDIDLDSHRKYLATCLIEDTRAIRLPSRLLTSSGRMEAMLLDQVSPHTRAFREMPSGASQTTRLKTYRYFISLIDRMKKSLTPFELGRCESLAWSSKYVPKKSADIVGNEDETNALFAWLSALRVDSVDGGQKSGASVNKDARRLEKVKKPKKRKPEDLNDFLVSSDDEAEELKELGDLEQLSEEAMGKSKHRSMIRANAHATNSGSSARQLGNAVLLSGPHGCGKTSSVYAVAKELGIEIFELNSGSRRSGKDILEKVGDMAENHIVQRSSLAPALAPTIDVDSDTERLSYAVREDIASGRQGNVLSFFKPSGIKQGLKPAKPKPSVKARKKENEEQKPLQPHRQQKQSLILLEEVDVLFEEDKQFWMTVFTLVLNSKRPVVMTCTDEDLVPMQAIAWHAILRYSPPPVDLAVDYLLLVAANEGHILLRDSVETLYRSRRNDLRASITELDFWCQMGVGDRKGGLEWLYQRWPPGSDVDEDGNTIRVVSQNTYQSGMGSVGHDVICDKSSVTFDRDACLSQQLWREWQIPPKNQSLERGTQQPLPESALLSTSPDEPRMSNLAALEHLSDAYSALDVFCRVDIPTASTLEPLDTSLPRMSEKMRENYTEGLPLLEAQAVTDYLNLDTEIAVSMHLIAESARLELLRDVESLETSSFTFDSYESLCEMIVRQVEQDDQPRPLSRQDFAIFDPLAEPPVTGASSTATGLSACSFDREFAVLSIDLAPYVRIVANYDLELEAYRSRIASLMTDGGRSRKKQRTTRAARTALEGGKRNETRRERWFSKDLDLEAVLRTGGVGWAGIGARQRNVEDLTDPAPSDMASHNDSDAMLSSQGEYL